MTLKHGQPDAHTEISSDTHYSTITKDNHDISDTSDEDLRPVKRRRRCPEPAVTSPLHLQHSPILATSIETSNVQSQPDNECSPTTFGHKQHQASRSSRSLSPVTEALPAAEYQEWPFQGFLKRTRIGEEVTYNLEFRLPSISDHLHFPTSPSKLGFCSLKDDRPMPLHRTSHSPIVHSKAQHIKAKRLAKRNPWTKEEDNTLVRMKDEGCKWKAIFNAIPSHTPGSIQVRYSVEHGGGTQSKTPPSEISNGEMVAAAK